MQYVTCFAVVATACAGARFLGTSATVIGRLGEGVIDDMGQWVEVRKGFAQQ